MKRSLWLKLVGSFALVTLATAAVLIVSVRLITESRFARLVRDTDQARAEYLAPIFARWYAQQGGWRGVQELVDSLPPQMGMMGHGGGMMEMGNGMMPAGPRLVLAGPDGAVIADSAGDPLRRRAPLHGSAGTAVEVVSGGQVVGRLLVGSMMGPAFSAADRRFLGSVSTAVLLTSAAAVLLALLAGSLLFRHIVSPLRRLSRASERIAAGDLAVRVPENASDELGELAARFNAMAAALQDSRRRQRQLVADTAHELRTPVSLIQGTLEMMVEGIYPADRHRLEQLYEESRRLGRLVADMQDLSRADAGRMELSFTRVRIEEMLEEAVAPFRAVARGKGVDLQVGGAAPAEEVTADRDRLVRVLANLLANALRHTPDGGRIRVDMERSADRSRLVVCVQDSGPGIPAHEAERVFDRFYRTDGSRSRDSGGSGLGLAISREIVTAHGGRIWVDAACRAGARVCFSIPLERHG